ncbi:MAG: sterol desaturase family protein, partial [Phycisphaerae bacterium]|nr:sterol desaturase family protein [Phycisphaerae bacterium]
MGNKYLVPLILCGVFLLLLLVEQVFPLRRRKLRLGPRFFVNLCCSAIALGAGATVVKTVAMFLSQWSAAHSVGLLFASPMPGPVRFVLGFVLMDLSFYHWHRVNHRFRILWRFHNVHHIDPDLDVSTSFRFHIVEILYSTVFRAAQVCV